MKDNMHTKMAGKACTCKTCGERKPLDSFVRTLGTYFGKDKRYQCIDCRVDSMYGEMMQEDVEHVPSVQEERAIKRGLRWIDKKIRERV